MTLQLGRDKKPRVRIDPAGRRYGECIGDVVRRELLDAAPQSVRDEWVAQIRCGRPVPLPGGLAGDPPEGFSCEECGQAPVWPLEEARMQCPECQQHGTLTPLSQYTRVATSRTHVTLHQCHYGHYSFIPFPQ
jgi:hypothetical protein